MSTAPTFLEYLSLEDAEWLTKTGEQWQVHTGEVVITEGVHPEHIFVVLEGEFEVEATKLDKQRIPRVGPGELLGEMSYLEERLPRNSVRAVTGSTLLAVRRSDIDDKCAADAAFRQRFRKVLVEFDKARMRHYRNPADDGDQDPLPETLRHVRVLIRIMLNPGFGDRRSPRKDD